MTIKTSDSLDTIAGALAKAGVFASFHEARNWYELQVWRMGWTNAVDAANSKMANWPKYK